MSNVVQFLEALARNPKALSPAEFIAAVSAANLDPAVRQALLQRDVAALGRLLDARDTMFCMVFPADNEEPKEDEPQREDEETPDQESASRAA
jgi:hypothetical protein